MDGWMGGGMDERILAFMNLLVCVHARMQFLLSSIMHVHWPNYNISPTWISLKEGGFPFLSYLLG